MDKQVQQMFFQWLAQKTGAKSGNELKAVVQQLGEEGLKKAYAQFMQEYQSQQNSVQAARQGAKLNYINALKGKCPEGTYLTYYQVGGVVCKKCMSAHKEGGDVDPITAFKNRKKKK